MSRSSASAAPAASGTPPPPRRSRPERQLDQWQALFDSQFSREETDTISRQLARMAAGNAATQAQRHARAPLPMRLQRNVPSYDVEGRLEQHSMAESFSLSVAPTLPASAALPAAGHRDRRRPRMHFRFRHADAAAEAAEDGEAGKMLLGSEIAARAQAQAQQVQRATMQPQTAEPSVAPVAIAAVAAVAVVAVAAAEPTPVPARAPPIEDDLSLSHERNASAPQQLITEDSDSEQQQLQQQLQEQQPQSPVDESAVSIEFVVDPNPPPQQQPPHADTDDSQHLDDFSIEHEDEEGDAEPVSPLPGSATAVSSSTAHHQHAASCMTGDQSSAARSGVAASAAGSPHAHSLSMGSDAAFSALGTHSPRAASASVDSGLHFAAAPVSASAAGSGPFSVLSASDSTNEQLLASLRVEPQDIALYGWARDPELEVSTAPAAVAVREAEAELLDLTQKPDSMERLLATPLRAHALLKFYGSQLKPLPSSARRTALNSLVAQAFASTSANSASGAKVGSKSPASAGSGSNATRQTRFSSMGDVVEAAVVDHKSAATTPHSAAASPTTAVAVPTAAASSAPASTSPLAPAPAPVPSSIGGWAAGSSTTDPKAILGYLMQLDDYATTSYQPPQQSDDEEEEKEEKKAEATPSFVAALAPAAAVTVAPSAAAAASIAPSADPDHDHGEWHADSGDEESRSHTNTPSSPASPAAMAPASPPADSLPPPALLLSRAPSSQTDVESPFVPFAPYSLATRNHLLAYLDILEFRGMWRTFADSVASTTGDAASSSPAEKDVATFTVGHGLRSLSVLLSRMQNAYLRPGAKASLGFSSGIVRPIEAAVEEFILAAAATLQGTQTTQQQQQQQQQQQTAAASSPSSAAQQAASAAALAVPSSPRPAAPSAPVGSPSPRSAAATAAPSLPLGLFDPLSQRLLQRLDQVLWAHYTAPAQNAAAVTPAATAGSTASAPAAGAAPDYSYVAAFHATRIRLLQRLSKLLVNLHVQRRPAVMQDLWQSNAVLHQWSPRASAEGTQLVTTRLQRQPSFLAAKAPSTNSVVVPPPLSAAAAAATVAAASAVSISARDQLVLLKLLNQSFTIPFLKSWLQSLQAIEDKLHAAQDKRREALQRAEQQREREALEAHEGDWSIPDEDDAPTVGGVRSRRASSAAGTGAGAGAAPPAPGSGSPPALPARHYPHTCFLFWMEVQAFRRCPRSEFRRRWARKLYQNYIAPPAAPTVAAIAVGGAAAAATAAPPPAPVIQLPNSIRRSIARACLGEHPPSATFLAAQSLAFTVLASYYPLLHLAPAYPQMIATIESFNAKFLEGLDENLRGLFANSMGGGGGGGGSNAGAGGSSGGGDDDVFALLSAADDSSVASSSTAGSSATGGGSIQFEDVLSGRGLLYFHQFLSAPSSPSSSGSAPTATDGDLSGLLFWLECQEYQRLPPGSSAQEFLGKQCAKVYETYLRGAAAGEMVVLSGSPGIREAIVRSLERPSPLLFNAAQRCVEDWLREEVFVRFASSDFATALKEERAAQSKNAEAAEKEQRIAYLRRKSAMSSMEGAALAAAGGINGAAGSGGSGASSSSSASTASKSASPSSPSSSASSALLAAGGSSHSSVSPTSLASSFGSQPPVLLFTDLLADAHLLGLFKEYLQANFAFESWMAWEDIQGYKSQPASDFRDRSAKKIYAKYFKAEAKMKITYLGETVAREIKAAMETAAGGAGAGAAGPSATIFAAAEAVLMEYLSVQAYSGFLASRQFSELPVDYLAGVVAQNEAREREEAERIAMEDAAWEMAEAHAQSAPQDSGQNGQQSQRGGHKDSIGSSSDSNRRDSTAHGGAGGLNSLSTVSVINAPRLTPSELRAKQIAMWESVTLESVLDDPCALARFKAFSLRMRCVENLLFYLACEEYRYIPSSSYLRVVANKIYQTYIKPQTSKNQVNLPGYIYREIEENLAACSPASAAPTAVGPGSVGVGSSSSSGASPSKKLFLSASTAIFRLMAADTFPRFLSSPEYRAYFEVDLPSRLVLQSRWQKIKKGDLSGSAGSAAVLPPRGTIIAPIRSALSPKAMALSWIDSEGEARMSLFGRPSAAAALAHKQAMAEVTKCQQRSHVRRGSAQRLQPAPAIGSSPPVAAALLPSNAAMSMSSASQPTTYRLSYVGAAGLGLPSQSQSQTQQRTAAASVSHPPPQRKGSTIAEGDVTLEIDEDE